MAKTAPAPIDRSIAPARIRGAGRALLLIGFAFAVMADPVSSVAYTIEASLRSLHGHLGLLLATQLIVLAIIAIIDLNYARRARQKERASSWQHGCRNAHPRQRVGTG